MERKISLSKSIEPAAPLPDLAAGAGYGWEIYGKCREKSMIKVTYSKYLEAYIKHFFANVMIQETHLE